MGEIGFLNQDWLLALAILPFAYLALQRLMNMRLARLRALGSPSAATKLAVYGPLFLLLCAVLALSRPYFGYEDVKIPRVGRDVMLVVDVSLSMATRDISPNRMDFAKRKLRDIIDHVARTSGGDRLGIVLFAGESYLYCPLTADYAVLKTFSNSISVGLIASGGSAITQALVTAANSFSTTKALKPGVLLISDGEDNELVVQRSLDVLKGYKFRLWALGVGTPEGKPIELRNSVLLKDPKGQIVVSKLQEAALRQLSEGSGGTYQRATLDDSDIETLFADIGKRLELASAQSEESKIRVYNEYGPLILWAPLALIAMLLLSSRRELIFGFAVCLVLSGRAVDAQEPGKNSPAQVTTGAPLSPYEAQSAFANGDYEGARNAFEHFHKLDPSDSKVLHGLAASEFRLGRFKEASELFDELAKQAQSGRERFGALYDKGTSALNAKDLNSAISALEAALEIKPGDEAALHNLSLARQLKEQQQREEKQENKDEKQEQKQNQEQEKEDQQQSSEQKQDQQDEHEQQKNQEQTAGEEEPRDKSEQSDSDKNGQNAEDKDAGQEENSSEQSEDRQENSNDKGTQQSEEEKSSGGESPTPSAQESGKQSGEEGQEENPGAQGTGAPQNSGGTAAQHDPKALKEREAQAWLESLDDSPVLLRRQVGNRRSNSQQSW